MVAQSAHCGLSVSHAALSRVAQEAGHRGPLSATRRPRQSGRISPSEFEAAVRKLRPQRIVMVEPGEWRVKQTFDDAAERLGCRAGHAAPIDTSSVRTKSSPNMLAVASNCGWSTSTVKCAANTMCSCKTASRSAENGITMQKIAAASTSRGRASCPFHAVFDPMRSRRECWRWSRNSFPIIREGWRNFDWPVTARQAKQALEDFVQNRLGQFGQYQDAMWTGEPYLYHSRLSAAMNLKLLDPRDVIHSAVAAYHAGLAPLNAVEGFVRQILGWREYVRGDLLAVHARVLGTKHAARQRGRCRDFYWTGDTDMNCLREAIGQTLDHGYAHHIQRLMVTGLFALLLGVDPKEVHKWYLAVYVDAVEWVELPNTLGMSQFADDGVMASKPYAATGKYIQRMSNYCAGCRFKPDKASGDDACPFTTLYWDFLMRHEKLLAKNQRMSLQVNNVKRKSKAGLRQIRERAAELLAKWDN